MELTLPEVAAKTRHMPHGMLRLPTGKMSSRTGEVITAEELLGQIKEKLRERVREEDDLDPAEREAVTERMAVGAIKYSILKQNPGQDIVFDFDKSLSFQGDSGPYLQYTYARLRSILRKAAGDGADIGIDPATDPGPLEGENEFALMRKLFEFPEAVERSVALSSASTLATYLYKLAVVANKFYETTPILKDDDAARRAARLLLADTAARTLRSGLSLLGIATLEKI